MRTTKHIVQKKAIYQRYKEGLKDIPVHMNPFDEANSVPNYWLSCMIIDKEAMCKQVRSEREALYTEEKGRNNLVKDFISKLKILFDYTDLDLYFFFCSSI